MMETRRRKNEGWGDGWMVGAFRTARDRKSQWNNPQSQEVRSLSSQSLLQLCGSRRPHSWTDLHLITLTNKAPNFVLKAVRVFSDLKKMFDSSPLPGQPLPWAPASEAPWSLFSLSQLSPGTAPRPRGEELGKTKQPLKKEYQTESLPNFTHSYCLPFSLRKSVISQEIPTSFDKSLY